MRTEFSLSLKSTHFILSILFFCSGCSALIYQIMWQRLLFDLFGVDIISVTIIISVFMFGLGVGGLLGGYIADFANTQLLFLYLAIETAIALFGFFSPFLIQMMGNYFVYDSEFLTAIISFIILAFPTFLMGATFPILVMYVNRYTCNIGSSVGSLYFANTLGAAIGAYFAGFVLLSSMDLVAAINRAAYLNLAIAATVWLLFRNRSVGA